jgi:hypothetical protein
MLHLIWPIRLRTPHLDVQTSFDELSAVLSRLPKGHLHHSTNEGRRRVEFDSASFRCWIEEDPGTGLLHSAAYDDPAGRLWNVGTRRKVRLYLDRHSSGGKWALLHNQHGYHSMWRNDMSGQRAVYGLHGDVVLIFADRGGTSDDAGRESPAMAPAASPTAADGALSPDFLLSLFPSATGATEADILRIEENLGAALPTQYRQLLAHANGGAPKFACYEHSGLTIYVQYLFGFEPPEDGDLQGIDWQMKLTGAPLTSKRLIPIARGGDADIVFISLITGEIHYRKASGARIVRVADSLGEFLAHLKDGFS